MSVDERLVEALKSFGFEVYNGVEMSREDRCYAFNYSTMPDTFADDSPVYERYIVQVHMFAPLSDNVSNRKRKTQKALFDAGFTWPSVTDASDGDNRHIVFECQYVERIDGDGEF